MNPKRPRDDNLVPLVIPVSVPVRRQEPSSPESDEASLATNWPHRSSNSQDLGRADHKPSVIVTRRRSLRNSLSDSAEQVDTHEILAGFAFSTLKTHFHMQNSFTKISEGSCMGLSMQLGRIDWSSSFYIHLVCLFFFLFNSNYKSLNLFHIVPPMNTFSLPPAMLHAFPAPMFILYPFLPFSHLFGWRGYSW